MQIVDNKAIEENVEVISKTTLDQYLLMPEDDRLYLLYQLKRYIKMTISAYLRFCSISNLLTFLSDIIADSDSEE